MSLLSSHTSSLFSLIRILQILQQNMRSTLLVLLCSFLGLASAYHVRTLALAKDAVYIKCPATDAGGNDAISIAQNPEEHAVLSCSYSPEAGAVNDFLCQYDAVTGAATGDVSSDSCPSTANKLKAKTGCYTTCVSVNGNILASVLVKPDLAQVTCNWYDGSRYRPRYSIFNSRTGKYISGNSKFSTSGISVKLGACTAQAD